MVEKQQTRTDAQSEWMKLPVRSDTCLLNSNPVKTDGPSGYWTKLKENTQSPYF